MRDNKLSGDALAQMVLDQQGYIVVASAEKPEPGAVRAVKASGAPLSGPVVVIAEATLEDYLEQSRRFGVDTYAIPGEFYFKAIAE